MISRATTTASINCKLLSIQENWVLYIWRKLHKILQAKICLRTWISVGS